MSNLILKQLSKEFDDYIESSSSSNNDNSSSSKKRKSKIIDKVNTKKTSKKRKKKMNVEVERDYNLFQSVFEFVARKTYRSSERNIITKEIENDRKFIWNQIDIWTDKLFEFFNENENEELNRLINFIRKIRFFTAFSSEHLKGETPRCTISRKYASKGKCYKIHFEIPGNIDLKTGKKTRNDNPVMVIEDTVELEYYNFIRYFCFLQKLEGSISAYVRKSVGSTRDPKNDEKLNQYLISDERKQDQELILSTLKEAFTFFSIFMKNGPQGSFLSANLSPLWFFIG